MVHVLLLALFACDLSVTTNPKTESPACPEDSGAILPPEAVVCIPAEEVCDGLDNDCDGVVDDGITAFLYLQDCDGDSHAEMVGPEFDLEGVEGTAAIISCLTAEDLPDPFHAGCAWTRTYGDCDDADPTIYAGQSEACDGLDNDCDGLIDEGC